MFKATVDGLGLTFGSAGAVEEREDAGNMLLQGAAELADLDQNRGDPGGVGGDDLLYQNLGLPVGFTLGSDDALVEALGRFNLDMPVTLEHRV